MTIAPTALLDSAQVAALLGVQPNTFRVMRAQPERHRSIDGIPAPIRFVGKSPVWDAEEINAWITEQKAETS